MSRVLKRISGGGTLGAFIAGDLFKLTPHVAPLKDDLDLWLLGIIGRNQGVCGSDIIGIQAEATGDVDIPGSFPLSVDNSSNQVSAFSDANGATLVCQCRFLVRVSNAGITVTPKVVYGTSISSLSSVATISGQAACNATSGAYTGSNQYQTVALALPAGANMLIKPLLTIGGTPASGYQIWGRFAYDCYIQS